MRLLRKLKTWARRLAGRPIKRAYAAASIGRLFASWVTQNLSADAEIKNDLKKLRARSRELSQNDPYARKFLKTLKSNVVGPSGVGLQSKVTKPRGQTDKEVNKIIEAAWKEFSKKKNATVTGCLSWVDCQNLFVESVARDGEILVRKVRGFPNPFGFSLQFIEADHLDDELNANLTNGNQIRMGVEKDRWRRPVAYYILTDHPGDLSFTGSAIRKHEIVPARDIIHGYVCERVDQTRGVPWMHAAMTRMNMLNGYDEAALVAARVGACKMGFLKTKTGSEYTGDDIAEDGNIISEAEPGVFEQIPEGWDMMPFDPKYPEANYPVFVKAMLRGISSGLSTNYNTLASDLEGVNYSSIRQGVLDDRDAYKTIQRWLIEHFHQEVFDAWLEMAMLTGAVNLPGMALEKVNSAVWRPRGWAWVDPQKDVDADIASLSNGLKTRTEILAEQGKDFEETLEQLKEEERMIKEAGLSFGSEPKKTDPKEESNGNGDGSDNGEPRAEPDYIVVQKNGKSTYAYR